MKKKLFALLLVCCIVLGMIPAVSAAETGTCGENLRWNFDSATGTLTINGSGEMYDFLDSDASKRVPWRDVRFDILEIIVEEGVTSLGEYAFEDCKLLQSVKLPDSLKKIRNGAFIGCYSLTDVQLPDALAEICNDVFHGCHALSEITLPDSITRIGMSAFQSTGLISVRIPLGVTEIESNAFTNCESLTEVVFHDGVEHISVGAFSGSLCLSHVELPENLVLLNSSAFAYTGLTRIEVPDSVREIGAHCFDGCENLMEIEMGTGVKKIGAYAFAGVPAKQIALPENLEYLDERVFDFCDITSIVIPRFVKSLGHKVFHGCQDLREIRFTGNAPSFEEDTLISLVTDVYYPDGYSTWTPDVLQNYGGTVNWVPYQTDLPEPPDIHEHAFCDWYTTKEPTMSETGTETRICSLCGFTETREIPRIPLNFDDVKEKDYFYQPVLWAVERGITAGVSNTRFAPNDSCTRAQVVTFLWRAAGKPEPTSARNPFRDVKSTDYFYDAVLWAVEHGITSGVSPTSFGPNSPCTRGQVVSFLHRAAGSVDPESENNPFSDVKAKDYYYKAVLWAVENGITSGMSPTSFGPGRTCTRGQVVSFLYRAENG